MTNVLLYIPATSAHNRAQGQRGRPGRCPHSAPADPRTRPAAAAVAALQKMMIVKAKVLRDGELEQIPAEQLVPGDVVSIEAGDIAGDGRLLRAATLEVAKSALTEEAAGVEEHRPGGEG
jgi:high-affinity K+ transport system ATPase subunit B